ncbi:MAG: hypothetical protein AB6733_21575 [Clostridiaceae bacterium]
MYKKLILLISILLLILTGCSNQKTVNVPEVLKPEAKQLVFKIVNLYNEINPEISNLIETQTEGSNPIKMYCVELK